MTYNIFHTSTPSSNGIPIPDNTLVADQSSLSFIGKNAPGYGSAVNTNFLHLLENFANGTRPAHPTQGQLWYDTSVNQLKINVDGTDTAGSWQAAGSVRKDAVKPVSSFAGDLWIDNVHQQLYLYSGSAWVLVGPEFSSGADSGPKVLTIPDATNINHTIINFLVAGLSVAIIATEAFTPKTAIRGFETSSLKVGLNINPAMTMWGTAEKATALIVNGRTVDAGNFLRGDADSITNNKITIQNTRGLAIGLGSSVTELKQEDGSTVLSNTDSTNNQVFIRVRDSSGNVLNPLSIVGAKLGINNSNPVAVLDVVGNIVSTTSIAAGTSVSVGSTLAVTGTSTLGNDVTINGKLYLNPASSAALLPSSDNLYDLGSTAKKFNSVYASNFYGTFNGNITANSTITGSISGSASKWTTPVSFSLAGDITSPAISVDGTGGVAQFVSTLSPDFINTKTEATDSNITDVLVIYRPGVGLRKTSKQSFISNIPTVPVGAIFPWAGDPANNPNVQIPSGYLLCDGSEQQQTNYPDLFSVIGYTYKALGLLQGQSTFALPDLRGRFPLGPDNMDNGTTVSSAIDASPITTITTPADRVTDISADIIGASNGSSQVTLDIQNLPDHKHDLKGTNQDTGLKGNQYYAIRPSTEEDVADAETVSNLNLGPTEPNTAQYLPNSGGVDGQGGNLNVPVNTMNPYQTINYIIFTGVIV
jgi:microcystin-dependent protein